PPPRGDHRAGEPHRPPRPRGVLLQPLLHAVPLPGARPRPQRLRGRRGRQGRRPGGPAGAPAPGARPAHALAGGAGDVTVARWRPLAGLLLGLSLLVPLVSGGCAPRIAPGAPPGRGPTGRQCALAYAIAPSHH